MKSKPVAGSMETVEMRAVNAFVAPEHGRLCDVTRLGRVNADEVANAFAMFRVLAGRDINAVLYRRRGWS